MSKSTYRQRLTQISAVLRVLRPFQNEPELNKCRLKCGASLPREAQYWSKSRKRGKIYLSSPCYLCCKRYFRKRYDPHRKQRRAVNQTLLREKAVQARERNGRIVEEFRRLLK